MRRQLRRFCFTFLLGSACFSSAYSQSPSATSLNKEDGTESTRAVDPIADAVGQQVAAFAIAINNRDAKSVAAFWTQDGEYVDGSGQMVIGRAANETYFAEHFAASPDAKLQLVTDSVRLLSDSTANRRRSIHFGTLQRIACRG